MPSEGIGPHVDLWVVAIYPEWEGNADGDTVWRYKPLNEIYNWDEDTDREQTMEQAQDPGNATGVFPRS